MEEKDLNRESAAQKMFNTSYDSLSPWGQQHVDRIIIKFTGKSVETTYNPSVDNVSVPLLQQNERLASLAEQLQIENEELWMENADLRGELAELRGQIK